MDTKISIKLLSENECDDNLLENYIRYQETKKAYVFDENSKTWEIKDVDFIDDWDNERKIQIVNSFRECIHSNGRVVIAKHLNEVVAFAVLYDGLFGSQNEYLSLSMLHVSKPYRFQGIGVKVFESICEEARKLNGKKLYIGSHPSIETQGFYRKTGCTFAKEINEGIYNHEPKDCQLEFNLY